LAETSGVIVGHSFIRAEILFHLLICSCLYPAYNILHVKLILTSYVRMIHVYLTFLTSEF